MTSELHDVIKKSRGLAPTSRARYLHDIDQWIEFAGVDPVGWTRARAQEFYDHLLDVKQLRPQSANRLIASLKYASKWWAHFANRPELDFAHVQKAKASGFDEKRALERVEVFKLLTSIRNEQSPVALRDFAICVVLLETGMRKMSLCSMTIERTLIDPERITATHTKFPLSWIRMKGRGIGADFPVPLSDTAIAAILPWRAWLATRGTATGPLFRGLVERVGARGLVMTPSKTPLYEDTINKMLDRRAAEAGIGHIYPHQFRHTFVTWRLEGGLQPYEVAAFTGHAVRGIGAMSGYIDNSVIAQKVRNSTPEWLRELVAR